MGGDSCGGFHRQKRWRIGRNQQRKISWTSSSALSCVCQLMGPTAGDSAGELLGQSAGMSDGKLGIQLSAEVGSKLGDWDGVSPGP